MQETARSVRKPTDYGQSLMLFMSFPLSIALLSKEQSSVLCLLEVSDTGTLDKKLFRSLKVLCHVPEKVVERPESSLESYGPC